MIQITNSKTLLQQPDQIDAKRLELQKTHCIVLKSVLSPSLKTQVRKMLKLAVFEDNEHIDVGNVIAAKEEKIPHGAQLDNFFRLILQRDDLLEALIKLTGVDDLDSCFSRVCRLSPHKDHFYHWHTDIIPKVNRRFAIVIHLNDQRYQGGNFQIRESSSKVITKEIEYLEFGDAHLFEVDEKLSHRISPLQGEFSRVSCVAWFASA